ncbi:MAG: glycosyl hydrolase, partial [Gammaproteobacteria bacterium]|nr:glycosyl hydrolase [Gammaproteobacteria bacterium]
MSNSTFYDSVISKIVLVTFGWAIATPTCLATDTVDPGLLSAMEWRLVGPYRGGRVTTVTGVADNPQLYYMGATGGGVWKTANAGLTWENISDGFINVGTIGAIAVAESDPNVIYVGTGEKSIRGVTTSQGDGIYKSTDAGATWAHAGLPKAGQIARIKIHPSNPDVAYAAVQGQIWGPNPERGVYRTTDGGETWARVLSVDAQTGATDLRMDPTNPRILYAAMWEHGRKPWYVLSGGTAGGIFKSTDAGDNWEQLSNGLPELIGKIGVDVSASNPNRLYAIVEAMPGQGGLYRSDDGGTTWELKNGSRILWTRSWYYMHIAADPVNENIVYVLNAPFMKSIDGGVTFEKKAMPHGDHHDHWINPHNNRNMINANDGGATITFDGGESWSSILNQPTAQFYRVNTDNQFPYRIYGGQQDNDTVAILSQTYDDGIGSDDYFAVGGGESAHIAFDADNPRLVYATTINGTLTEFDVENGRLREIKPYPEFVFGMESKDLRYRTNWNAPVTASPQDPGVIYYGTEKLLRTTDRGVTFEEISPDLTKNEKDKQGPNGGPITAENVGAEFYGTILTITASPHERGTIWVGSDDGLIHITRNDGESWDNVTPGNLRGAMVNSIEVSPHDPGTAYVAVTGYKLNDFRPYIYKLTDYGRRAERIDKDLPDDNFIRVVREDPERQGLLFAGGEVHIYVSFDDGEHWQSLGLNLPPVPVTDLAIRQDDLVAATQGRAFWVFEDLPALRQAKQDMADKPLHVFTPGPAEMIKGRIRPRDFEGENPPRGIVLNYHIRDEHEGPLTIEITDSDGNSVRSYSSEEGDFERCVIANEDQRLPVEVEYPPKEQGANMWAWDMRRNGLHCIDDIRLFEGFAGAYVKPGTYQARVAIGEAEDTVTLTLVADRRIEASDSEILEVEQRIARITALMNELLDGLAAIRKSRGQIEALMADFPDAESLQQPGRRAIERLTAWEREVLQVDFETYEDEDNLPGKLVKQVRHLLDVMDDAGPPVAAGAKERQGDLEAQWADLQAELRQISASDIAAVNNWT